MTVFPAGFGLTANLTGSSNCTPHLQKHSGDRSSSPLAGNITWAVRGHQTRVPEVQSNIPKAQRRGKDSGDDAGQGWSVTGNGYPPAQWWHCGLLLPGADFRDRAGGLPRVRVSLSSEGCCGVGEEIPKVWFW